MRRSARRARRSGFACVAAFAFASVAAGAPPAGAAPARAAGAAEPAPAPALAPALAGVRPVRDGDLLACLVETRHLPGERIASSLKSGLPSAIEMALSLLDDRDRVVAENRVSFRIAYDLWEEIFRVDGAGTSERFSSLESLASHLESLPRLPVGRIDAMESAHRHRLRVGMELHAVAPRETERLDSWVAGGGEGPAGESDRSDDGREVSVSLGQVIRFFYRGGRSDADAGTELLSEWFVPGDIPDLAKKARAPVEGG